MEGASITVVGAGAIGSHLLPHLARMPEVGRITVVDPDSYSAENVMVQNIFRQDIGHRKARVLARNLHRIQPRLQVAPITAAVEDVPLGLLRADVILAAVDSRRARQAINEAAWRLAAPWCDSGVLGSEMLARVNVYVPSAAAPCLECAWDQRDYDALEQEYPCGARTGPAFPSRAPAPLAAVAASLLALECQKLLSGREDCAAIARQVTIDARRHNIISTSYRRRPECRFDHRTWRIEPLPCRMRKTRLEDVLKPGGSLRIAGHRFVKALVCLECGRRDERFRLNRPPAICPECGRRMATPGFDAFDVLDDRLPGSLRRHTLAQVGIRAGDVVNLNGGDFEIVAERL